MRKQCVVCEKRKPLNHFPKVKGSSKSSCACVDCWQPQLFFVGTNRRDDRYHFVKKYGITEFEYRRRLAMQAGVCAVCGKGARKRKLNVDHDHVTGKVRGLLCTRCNITLGKMRDKPPIGSALAKYIFHANSAKTPKIK